MPLKNDEFMVDVNGEPVKTALSAQAFKMLEEAPGTAQQKSFAQLLHAFFVLSGDTQMSPLAQNILARSIADLANTLEFKKEDIDPIIKVMETISEMTKTGVPMQ